MSPDLQKAKKVAQEAAVKAGDFLKQYQPKVTVKKYKDLGDIQTDADLKAEKIISQIITKSFPQHNIFSEEAGLTDKHSEYTWTIDPLDGTKEYIRGRSIFLTLVSLETKSDLLVGCVYNPNTKNIFSAAKGNHAFKNFKQKLSVSKTSQLKHAIIAVTLPTYVLKEPKFSQNWQFIRSLAQKTYRVRGFQFDALNICHTAQGAMEGFCCFTDTQFGPKWWDIAASLTIAQEAGAKITDLSGKPLKNQDLTNGIVVTNGLIHHQLLRMINQSL